MASDRQRQQTPFLHKVVIVLIVIFGVLLVLAYLAMQTLEGSS